MVFIAAVFIIIKMSSKRWMDKQMMVCPHNGILLSNKKE